MPSNTPVSERAFCGMWACRAGWLAIVVCMFLSYIRWRLWARLNANLPCILHTTNDSTLHPKPTLSLQAEETNPKEDLQHQNDARAQTPRVLCTYMVECRVSILGITIMSWGSICHNRTWDPLGYNGPIITLNSTYSLHCSSFSWFNQFYK